MVWYNTYTSIGLVRLGTYEVDYNALYWYKEITANSITLFDEQKTSNYSTHIIHNSFKGFCGFLLLITRHIMTN